MLVTKYWNTSEESLSQLAEDIRWAVEDMEEQEVDEIIVNVHVDDHHGRYIPMILTCMLKDIPRKDYEDKYEIGGEEEIDDFDDLLEELDEELQVLVKEYDLLPPHVSIYVGWYDGAICTVVTANS